MKRLIVFLLCTVALLSCEGPMGPPGEPGFGTDPFIETYTVRTQDWVLVDGEADQLGTYYIYEFDEPHLTSYIYRNGNVTGYMVQLLNDGTEVQTPLPFIIHEGQETPEGEALWTETYTFDFKPNTLTFLVRYSDFFTGNRPPTCTFRIVMTW